MLDDDRWCCLECVTYLFGSMYPKLTSRFCFLVREFHRFDSRPCLLAFSQSGSDLLSIAIQLLFSIPMLRQEDQLAEFVMFVSVPTRNRRCATWPSLNRTKFGKLPWASKVGMGQISHWKTDEPDVDIFEESAFPFLADFPTQTSIDVDFLAALRHLDNALLGTTGRHSEVTLSTGASIFVPLVPTAEFGRLHPLNFSQKILR